MHDTSIYALTDPLGWEQTMDTIIGRRLRTLMETSGLTLAELSLLSGIAAVSLEEHLDGTVPIPLPRLRLLAAALDTDPVRLLIRLMFPIC